MRGIFNIAYFFIIVKYFFKSFFKDGFFINILYSTIFEFDYIRQIEKASRLNKVREAFPDILHYICKIIPAYFSSSKFTCLL